MGFLADAAFLNRYAVDFDQLVDHVRGGCTRTGDQRSADPVAVHRFGSQSCDGELVEIAGDHEAGSAAPEPVELFADLAGQHAQVAGVDAYRAEPGAGGRPPGWPARRGVGRV